MTAPRRHVASERPKAAFRLGRRFRLLRAARGRGRKRNAVGNVPPTCVSDSGEHRSTRKTIKCKSPPIRRDVYWRRPTAEGPWQINRLWLFQKRDGGEEGGGRRWRWRGDRRITLRSVALSFTSVCWLSSGEQIETNRICRSSPTSLTVIWQPSPA